MKKNAKYIELGDRTPICVKKCDNSYGEEVYMIFRGDKLYEGRIGSHFLYEKSWDTAEAQDFLDRLAKVRGWKEVRK